MAKSVAIIGPTASGKTNLAVAVAYKLNGEVISVDSRQVYKGMDIGTGKDLSEYHYKNTSIPYHLIDIVDAGTKYNLKQFQEDFYKAYSSINKQKKIPVLCGGTGLYLEAVLNGYNRTSAKGNNELQLELEKFEHEALIDKLKLLTPKNQYDTSTKKRTIRAIQIERSTSNNSSNYPKVECNLFLIDISREQRRFNISKRLQQRFDEGMISEVEQLLKQGVDSETLVYYGLEYKYITQHLQGLLTFQELFTKLETEIHRFAKRQATWFRRMERNGFSITKIPYELSIEEKVSLIQSHIN